MVQGLLLFPSSVIVPMLEIIWVLLIMLSGEEQALHGTVMPAADSCACDAGNIYFGVMAAFSKLQLAMFGVGVAILMAGVYFLVPPDSDTGKVPQ